MKKLRNFRQEIFSIKICQHKYFVSSQYLSVKIVTGAEASQFKSMRFRNYGKFSCTSGSVYPRAYKGRAWPWSHGNEDGSASVRRSGTFIQVFWEAQVPLALTIVLP